MLARYVFLAVVSLGALVAASKLAPGDLERLAMLERDGRHEQARDELQRLYESGERNPRMMLRLYNLKVRFGEVDGARTVLEEYARLRPTDTEAQNGLIRFYQINHLEAPYLDALRKLQERTRSRELLAELVSFYRMTGRFREEEDLLERTARANRAGPAEFERLGLLAAARGDLPRAVRALRRADGRLLDDQSRPARLGLFRVLVELKETDEAHQRSVVWLRTWRSPELTVEFMDALSLAGRSDLAIDIGQRFGGPGNDATLVTAELLHEQSRNAEALQRLNEYQSNGLPEEPDRIQRFVSVAAATGAAEVALKAARLVGLRKLDANVVVDLIDALQDASESTPGVLQTDQLRGFAAEIEARLQNVAPVGQESPDRLILSDDLRLFSCRLAILDKDRDLARRFLTGIDADRLSSQDLSLWTDLQLASGLRSTAFPNLPKAWQRRDRADLVVRRWPRPDRAQSAGPAAAGQVVRPRTTEAPGARPAAVATTGPVAGREVSNAPQVSGQDVSAARARRLRRRAEAVERRRDRERARLSAQRREQQLQGGTGPPAGTPAKSPFAPAPSASTTGTGG